MMERVFLRGEVDFRDGFHTEPANNPARTMKPGRVVGAELRVSL